MSKTKFISFLNKPHVIVFTSIRKLKASQPENDAFILPLSYLHTLLSTGPCLYGATLHEWSFKINAVTALETSLYLASTTVRTS